ncbi:glycosyltransferase family 2 protein [Candidatus Uhrbacteria bacterium]|nr:glycosyltransferase family 2 protein [Candidatus Uhrbacteria bacterium]
MTQSLVSIIIRTKNEEAWIGRTLSAIETQTYQNREVIVVDTGSTDRTLEIAKKFPCQMISHEVSPYRPGQALNAGIRASQGSFLVLLSAHAVPADSTWLEQLVTTLSQDNQIAGVYGRQLPLPESSPFDKRDLLITFGPEKKIQRKDNFFHNANSIIRRGVWEHTPFDETATNIEDRLWTKAVQERGFAVVYEPEACVYHHHGIHQYGNVGRCETTVRILEQLEPSSVSSQEVDRQLAWDGAQQILTILPLSDEDTELLLETPYGSDQSFLDHVLGEIARATLVRRVVVASKHPVALERARLHGFKTFFYLTPMFNGPTASLEEVLQTTLAQEEVSCGFTPSHVLFFKGTHVFRTAELIDALIKKSLIEKEDSVFVAKKEYRAVWALEDGIFARKDSGFVKHAQKDPLWMGYTGLGCITKTTFIHAGARLGESVAVVQLDHALSLLDIQEDTQREMAKHLFFKRHEIGL